MANILIIDDEPRILHVLRRILEESGHTVADAANGKIALLQFAGSPTDLVITDIFMPEMDGFEVIMEMKKAFPGSRIIAMSGGGFLPKDNVLGAASMLGVHAVLEKPFEVEEVQALVNQVLASG